MKSAREWLDIWRNRGFDDDKYADTNRNFDLIGLFERIQQDALQSQTQAIRDQVKEFLEAERRWYECGCGTPENVLLDEKRKVLEEFVKSTSERVEGK